MFYLAKALLAKRGIHPKTHKGVISLFGREFVKTGEISKETFKLLNKSQDNRHKADYYVFIKFAEDKTKKDIDDGETFINHCLNFLSE